MRDRLVVGRRDKRLSEQLQMDPELTLEKAVNKARQSEQVKKQLENLKINFKAEASSTQLDSIQSWQRSGSKQSKQQDRQTFHKKTLERQTQCNRCGDTQGHHPQQCPAREAVCNQCRKKGHYASLPS